jgi:Short C-terminal domain
MRRRPVGVGRRGPGIVGTMARTAVVAGTATVVAKGVSGSMDSHAQAQQQAAADAAQSQADMQQMQAQMNQMQYQMAQQPAPQPVQATQPAYAAPAADMTTQLQNLAQLKQSGALTDDEYQAAKAKLLGS